MTVLWQLVMLLIAILWIIQAVFRNFICSQAYTKSESSASWTESSLLSERSAKMEGQIGGGVHQLTPQMEGRRLGSVEVGAESAAFPKPNHIRYVATFNNHFMTQMFPS